MCFLQFLTSQGDILKLIYVGAAVNTKVCRSVGVKQVKTRKFSRSVWGELGSVGHCHDTHRCPLGAIVCAHLRGDLLRRALRKIPRDLR